MNDRISIWVNLPYACYGIEVGADGRVAEAPPIARWMIRKEWSAVRFWIEDHGGEYQRLE